MPLASKKLTMDTTLITDEKSTITSAMVWSIDYFLESTVSVALTRNLIWVARLVKLPPWQLPTNAEVANSAETLVGRAVNSDSGVQLPDNPASSEAFNSSHFMDFFSTLAKKSPFQSPLAFQQIGVQLQIDQWKSTELNKRLGDAQSIPGSQDNSAENGVHPRFDVARWPILQCCPLK